MSARPNDCEICGITCRCRAPEMRVIPMDPGILSRARLLLRCLTALVDQGMICEPENERERQLVQLAEALVVEGLGGATDLGTPT